MSCVGIKYFFKWSSKESPHDVAICIAVVMAKVSFTTLKDPRGYFRERWEHVQGRFCKRKVSVRSLSVVLLFFASSSTLDPLIALIQVLIME